MGMILQVDALTAGAKFEPRTFDPVHDSAGFCAAKAL